MSRAVTPSLPRITDILTDAMAAHGNRAQRPTHDDHHPSVIERHRGCPNDEILAAPEPSAADLFKGNGGAVLAVFAVPPLNESARAISLRPSCPEPPGSTPGRPVPGFPHTP